MSIYTNINTAISQLRTAHSQQNIIQQFLSILFTGNNGRNRFGKCVRRSWEDPKATQSLSSEASHRRKSWREFLFLLADGAHRVYFVQFLDPHCASKFSGITGMQCVSIMLRFIFRQNTAQIKNRSRECALREREEENESYEKKKNALKNVINQLTLYLFRNWYRDFGSHVIA